MLRGLAQAHALRTDARLNGLAVFDGKVGDGVGGTATIVNVWAGFARCGRSRGKAALDLRLIDIEAIREGTPLRWRDTVAPSIK